MGQRKELEKTKTILEEEVKRAEARLKQLQSYCTHQKKNGRLDLVSVDADKNVFKCNACGANFSITIRTKDEIINAVDILVDVMNQVKSLASDEDYAKYVKRIGDILADLVSIPSLYAKLVLERGRGNNNNHNKNNNNRSGHRGKYGAGNVNIF